MRDGHLDAVPDRLAAVILAGGRARRLGGRDKPMVAVGGVPMLGRVIDAVGAAGAEPVVVVGPVREGLPDGVLYAREEPAGGGPAAAAAAGLAQLRAGAEAGVETEAGIDAGDRAGDGTGVGAGSRAGVGGGVEVVALLAGDLPQLTGEAVRLLVRVLRDSGGADGAVFVDGDGRRQLLCGVWRIRALAGAVRALGDLEGVSLRRLMAGLEVCEVRWGGGRAPYFDCDTEDDLVEAQADGGLGRGPESVRGRDG